MPFALVTIGLLLIVVGAKGTHKEFGREVASEFTGPNNFTWWIVSLGAVGSLGYVKQLRAFSTAFMALIVIAMVIANRGFFDQLTAALAKGPDAIKRSEGVSTNSQAESNALGLKELRGAIGDGNKATAEIHRSVTESNNAQIDKWWSAAKIGVKAWLGMPIP